MAFLAAATPWLMAAGTVLSAASSVAQANSAKKSSEFKAKQLEQNAKAANASAQRQAIEERRQATLASSRLQNLAQGGNSDPTIINLHEDIAGEGEYRALTALYEGSQEAAGLSNQASAAIYSGKAAQRAGYLDAASTVMSSSSSLYDKYGGTGSRTRSSQRGSSRELDSAASDRPYLFGTYR